MFRIGYILITRIARFALPVAAIFIKKLNHFVKQRKIGNRPYCRTKKYWIHAASLGEYEMATPLIKKLLIESTLEDLVITIFSPSGYNQAIKGEYASSIMYLPLDDIACVRDFYDNYAPQKAIFVRYDFWYNFINEGQRIGVEFYLINGRFQENHFILKPIGKPYLKLLRNFKQVFTSDQTSTALLQAKKVAAKYTGDTRYDRVSAIVSAAPEYTDIETFKGNRKLLIVGSSWQPEEQLILHLLRSELKNLAILIAPHDIKRSDAIAEYLKEYEPKKYTEGNFSDTDQVLILNTIGMLSGVYRYADFALIGGGFSGALHNILEPAVWGCHLSYGPQIAKFPEAQEFVNAGFAEQIIDRERWVEELNILINNDTLLSEVKTKAKNYTAQNVGATACILSFVQ